MSLQSVLSDTDELHSFSDLSTFAQHIPVEWVASALDLSSSATIRRRRLPSDQVLWLVLGMALFRNEPISEVARRLNLCAQGLASDSLLSRSGVSQARQRLGAEPLQCLFRQTGECWGKERYPGDDWHGLQVLAADGAVLRIPDTPALREHFGSGNTSTVNAGEVEDDAAYDRQAKHAVERGGLPQLVVQAVGSVESFRKGIGRRTSEGRNSQQPDPDDPYREQPVGEITRQRPQRLCRLLGCRDIVDARLVQRPLPILETKR